MSYVFYGKSETDLAKLQVFYVDPLISTTRGIRFRFIPVEGQLVSVILSLFCRSRRLVSF